MGVREDFLKEKPLERDLGDEWGLASHRWTGILGEGKSLLKAIVVRMRLEK